MEDGSSLLRPEIASGKAWSALGMGFGTRNLAGRAQELPSFFGALSDLARGRVLPVPGGVLVRDQDGTVIGAVKASAFGRYVMKQQQMSCRDMELLCTQQAVFGNDQKWLGQAERWGHLAQKEASSRFKETGPMAMGPNTIDGDKRGQRASTL